jgi:hypothetical protein
MGKNDEIVTGSIYLNKHLHAMFDKLSLSSERVMALWFFNCLYAIVSAKSSL